MSSSAVAPLVSFLMLVFISHSFHGVTLMLAESTTLVDASAVPDGATGGHHFDEIASPRENRGRQRRRTKVAPLNVFLAVKDQFDARRRSVEDLIFQSLDAFSTAADGQDRSDGGDGRGTSPSRLYGYSAFFKSLRSMSVYGVLGESYHAETNRYVPGYHNSNNEYAGDQSNAAFFLSQDEPDDANAVKYAIVNVCAFLANAMAESIQFDTCEELNGMVYGGLDPALSSMALAAGRTGILSELGGVDGRYFPMSNACGQLGRAYRDESCPLVVEDVNSRDETIDVACPVDPNLEVTAEPHLKYNYWEGKTDAAGDQPPPPFFCLPKLFDGDHAGYWDGYDVEFVRRVAYPSALGEVDVEGCCFWGRGALMTRGTCGLGRVNYHMGMRAYDDGRPARYPQIDFCKAPSLICGASTALLNGALYPELKFVVALFDWVDRVQSHFDEDSGWEYLARLKTFVDDGMDDDGKFVDAVSSVVTRGCHKAHCSRRTIHFFEQRRRNFETLVHNIFNLQETWDGVPERPLRPNYDLEYAMRWINSKRSMIEGNILVSKNGAIDGVSYFSQEYKFEALVSALRAAALPVFGNRRRFFLVDGVEGLRGLNAGLANLAFFLANAMAESIASDSCDEVHWEKVDGRYSLANSCGQNGRDYGSEACPAWQSFMTCDVDKEAEIEADVPITAMPPFLLDAPPPFQCRPGTDPAGYYDAETGTLHDDATVFNSHGRSDVEGCCFWGRGALLTRGSCNYGKLNFHLGAQAAKEGRTSLYPHVDFCSNPEVVCDDDAKEMRFMVGMFEWIDRVQDYYDSSRKWSYLDELYKFVDGGMGNDVFIDSVSYIVARGCHALPCTSSFSIDTNRFLYGLERRMNFKNIIKLVFDLPIAAPADQGPLGDVGVDSPGEENELMKRPTFLPTFRPTFKPTPYPTIEAQDPSQSPAGASPLHGRISFSARPTGSPIERSDVTQFNDGKSFVINDDASSFVDESLVVTKGTTIVMEAGGYVEAPLNTDWPAVRISIASRFIGKGGHVNGSYADPSYLEGECEDGGVAIQINNGQSGPDTASYAEFYNGIHVAGGDAPDGIGGNALQVNGFGTEAVIYGGHFTGGVGMTNNGLSLYALNSANVHIRGGTFQGEIKAERHGSIILYGCFIKNGTRVTGVFADESEFDATIRLFYGGEVILVSIAEQICETAPSVSPTNFPTLSSRPTVPRRSHGDEKRLHNGVIIMAVVLILIRSKAEW